MLLFSWLIHTYSFPDILFILGFAFFHVAFLCRCWSVMLMLLWVFGV